MREMVYTLAEIKSGNIVGGYYSEDEALADVLEAIHDDGEDSVATLSLACDTGFIAKGADLAALARRRLGQRKTA